MPMDDDEVLRRAIRGFAYGDPAQIDPVVLLDRSRARRRRERSRRLLTAAVLAILVGGVVAWLALSQPRSVPPVEPIPSPSIMPTPTPTPTPTLAYPQQTRSADSLPSGGLGDTVAGLTLTAIDISDATCPDASRCPGSGALTVRNDSGQPIDALVFFYVFRDNSPAVGEAARVTLSPGEEATVTINVQPMLADNAPGGVSGSTYTWNFAVDRSPS